MQWPVYLFDEKPDAVSPWNASQEGSDNAEWAQSFVNIWEGPLPILAAGSYALNYAYPWPSTDYLVEKAYNTTVKNATKVYSGHLYATSNGTSLTADMNHVKTVTDLSVFIEKIATARSIHRPYILGKAGYLVPFILSAIDKESREKLLKKDISQAKQTFMVKTQL